MSEAPVLDAWICASCEQSNPAGTRFCGHCGRPAAAPPAPPAPPPPAQERRLVTALFADISGFTALADRLDPDELAEIVDVIVKALADVVGRHNGFIEKYAGDAVLAVFGAPASREDDAARALDVALEMHDALAALLPSLPPDAQHLELHIGVNSGHAIAREIGNRVRTDYGVLGDAINVAQRLESAAPAGKTYVGDLTKRLARGRFALEPLGPLALKGKPEPVMAWRLTGRAAAGAAAAEAPVAREVELGALRAALDRLRAGRGGIVVVTGEAGAGKSSVLEAFRGDAERRGCTWLEAWTPSDAGDLAYAPVVDLLARLAGSPSPTNPARWAPALAARLDALALGPRAAPLLALAGVAEAAPAEVEPEAFARALTDSLAALVRAAAATGPVVLRLEDLHWADDDSLALVTALAADAPGTPFLLVATARTEAASVVAHLQTDSPDSRVVELAPLDEVGLAILVARHAGTHLGPDAVAAIQARSGGNPFFATEIVRSLLEAGAPLHRAEAWADAGLPPTVEGLLAARLDRLPAPARRAAEVAAAIGDDVPLALLEAVADDVPDIAEALEGLLAADLIDAAPLRDSVLTFHHALVREAAYGRIPGRRVRELHLRIADAAERMWGDRPDTLDLRARNLHLARAGRRAVAALLAAADRAERLYANDAAVVHLRHALEHLEPGEPTAQAATLRLADLHELRGEYADAHARYAELADGPLRAPAAIGRAASLRKRGDYPAALALVDAGLGDAAGADRAALLLERGRILMVADSFGVAIDSLQEGVALAAPGSVVAAGLLVELARAESSVDRLEVARDHALAAVAALAEHDDLGRRATALRVLGGVYEDLGQPDEAAAALREGLALARRVGRVEEIASCLLNLGVVELGRGNTAGAVEGARGAAAAFERIGHPGRAAAYANLAEALLLDGDEAEVRAMCDRAIELATATHDMLTVADALLTAAQFEARRGRHAAAAGEAARAAAHFGDVGAEAWAARALALAADQRAAAGIAG